jgi:hypothetical protein
MQSISFKDPVTGDSFSSNTYEVRRNGSGNVLRAKAPSGATAVKMQSTFDGVDDAPPNQFADDITQDELENFAEDMQESMNIATNPPGGFSRGIGRITSVAGGLGPGSWQALRLPSVGFGKRAGLISKFASAFNAFGIDRGTFRSGPYSNLITARMWADYINNMDMQDVGAELSAEVSAEEKLSIYQFCKEWEQDPGHVAFTQRLLNTKDVNSVDEIAKGNIVYDLMTGGIQPGPSGVKDPRNVKHDKMFRLAIDIINSMRLREYNFYSLNLVHRDEGTRLYDEFMSNYVPLESDEVEIIHEVMRGLNNHGQSYAMQTTDHDGDPMGAYDLMTRLGNAYNSGDTRLCRSILDTLFGYPYKFVPQVGYKGLFDGVSSRFIGQEPLHLYINNGWRWILNDGKVTNVRNGGKEFKVDNEAQLIEVLSYTYPKPIGVFTKLSSGNNKFSYMPWSQFESTARTAASMVPQSRGGFDERVRDAENREQQKDKTRSDGGGKGGKGGGGRRGRRNPAPKKNPGHAGPKYDVDWRDLEWVLRPGESHTEYLSMRDQWRTFFNVDGVIKVHSVKGTYSQTGKWDQNEPTYPDFTPITDRTVQLRLAKLGHDGYTEKGRNPDVRTDYDGFEPRHTIKRNPAPGRKGRKSGTLSLGRGKQYHIEILPRTQLNVKTKGAPGVDKKTGKSRPKGKSTVKSQGETGAERKAGITDAFGSYMHTGVDKKTGKKVPYVIKIPSKDFRAVNVEVEGKTIRTLMPMRKTSKAQQQAWAKFLSVYGYPKLANTKGDPVRFKIHKPTRGTFYRQLAKDRKKAGA